MSGAPWTSWVRPRMERATGQRSIPSGRGLEGRIPRRFMLIGTRKGTIIHSTLNHASRTDPGALPQRRGLERSFAGTPGRARIGTRRNAGGPVRNSGRVPDGSEIRKRLPHGGHRARRRAAGNEAGRPVRACRGTRLLIVQRPDRRRHRPGHLPEALLHRPSRRRVQTPFRHVTAKGD